jgi:hypothetical protein
MQKFLRAKTGATIPISNFQFPQFEHFHWFVGAINFAAALAAILASYADMCPLFWACSYLASINFLTSGCESASRASSDFKFNNG